MADTATETEERGANIETAIVRLEERADEAPDQPQTYVLPYLVHLDPRDLYRNPHNPRKDVGDLTELKASMKAPESKGIVTALTVVPEEDGAYRIVAGHRRACAAAELMDDGEWPAYLPETVPCMAFPDMTGLNVDQLVSMLIENDQRLGIKESERAAGYAQLELFGVSPEMIAVRTGRKVEHVQASLKLVKMGEKAAAAADKGNLTLEDVARIERLESDPKALERVMKRADNEWGLRHQLTEEENKLCAAEQKAKLLAEFADAGVPVVKKPKDFPWSSKEAAVGTLRKADGERVAEEDVKGKEGFAAFIETYSGTANATLICLDPEAHGYKRTTHTSYKSPETLRAEEEARRAQRERSDRLAEAQELREQFIVQQWGTAKAAKTMVVAMLRAAAAGPRSLEGGESDLIGALLGGDVGDVTTAGVDRLHRRLVAKWIAAEEHSLVEACEGAYRSDRRRAASWLDRLAEAGYGLSDAETELREQLRVWIQQDDEKLRREAQEREAREAQLEAERQERQEQYAQNEAAVAGADDLDPAVAAAIAADEGVDEEEGGEFVNDAEGEVDQELDGDDKPARDEPEGADSTVYDMGEAA